MIGGAILALIFICIAACCYRRRSNSKIDITIGEKLGKMHIELPEVAEKANNSV